MDQRLTSALQSSSNGRKLSLNIWGNHPQYPRNLASLRSQIANGSLAIRNSKRYRGRPCLVPRLRGKKAECKSLVITEATGAEYKSLIFFLTPFFPEQKKVSPLHPVRRPMMGQILGIQNSVCKLSSSRLVLKKECLPWIKAVWSVDIRWSFLTLAKKQILITHSVMF